jgi:hypothetical protein
MSADIDQSVASADGSTSAAPAAAPPPAAPSAARSRRRHIIDISAITAIVSLVVALVFNGLQVRDSAEQARASRQATELGLLTQLNGIVARSESTVSPLDREFLQAEAHSGAVLSPKTEASLAITLKNLDYMAWLFNKGFVDIPGARQLWARRMKCMYATAVLVYGKTANVRLRNLQQFVGFPPPSSMTRIRNELC